MESTNTLSEHVSNIRMFLFVGMFFVFLAAMMLKGLQERIDVLQDAVAGVTSHA